MSFHCVLSTGPQVSPKSNLISSGDQCAVSHRGMSQQLIALQYKDIGMAFRQKLSGLSL